MSLYKYFHSIYIIYVTAIYLEINVFIRVGGSLNVSIVEENKNEDKNERGGSRLEFECSDVAYNLAHSGVLTGYAPANRG